MQGGVSWTDDKCKSSVSQALDEGSVPFTRSNVFNGLACSWFPVQKNTKKQERTFADAGGHRQTKIRTVSRKPQQYLLLFFRASST